MGKKLYILGKSNYALAIIFDIIKLRNWKEEVVVVKNIPDSQNTSSNFKFENGTPHSEINLTQFNPSEKDEFIIGSIGKSRKSIHEFFKLEYGIQSAHYRNIIHPTAVIAETVEMGQGLHIGPLSVVAPYSILDNHTTINRNVSVGHHTRLEEFACLNPGVNVSGICSIGNNVMIGAGAVVLDQLTIGKGSIIGAGSVVTRDVPAGVVAYGSPAKVVRKLT
jgi:sugar O-acyltransferase (sialic acid O-acetyltransferase NeuD family)